ncbi:uncharacterized protein LOC109200611 [Oreochromis niloticus]|uniref:uncharacterized protein LOC109200611 n=1 Tax=Oreochromis niloticus TaxID=8128 RepID=UPI000DF14740|nr:uncharacterized protein LOC109200611 [Oreochromis niloticus]CAI5673952.1 unnamed protein product [Mustela putorius furo]
MVLKELEKSKNMISQGSQWSPVSSNLSCSQFSIFLFFLPRLKTEDKKTEEEKKFRRQATSSGDSKHRSTKGQWHSSPFVEAPDINVKRTAVLRALPVYLREEDPEFFKTCNADALDELTLIDTPVALLTVVTNSASQTSPVHFTSSSMAVVVEEDLVMRDIPRFADAFALLFDLIYALHLEYPTKLVHTFTFVQKIFMGLDDGKPLKPCLHALKNDLLLKE